MPTLPELTTGAVRRPEGPSGGRPSAWLLLSGALLFAGALRAQAPPPQATAVPAAVDFTRDIAPIFEKHCYECHGPRKARGRLRLHAGGFIRRGGVSGSVIEAGHGDQSLLLQRVMGLVGDDQMPLDRDPLPPATIALLKAWIDQGATLPATDSTAANAEADVEEHWAYIKPKRPDLPSVTNLAWARNPIDRFVLAQLEQRTAAAFGRSRQAHDPAPRHARPHRAAAYAGGARGVPGRSVSRRIRAGRRSPARLAALWRALGAPVAGSRALRRHQRPREGQPPRRSGNTATG